MLYNLVGGVQQCLNDRWFTLIQVNERFLNLLGYTEEELQTRFQNHYINMIYPLDRDEVRHQVREQLKTCLLYTSRCV